MRIDSQKLLHNMFRNLTLLIIWAFTILISILWTYENPEKIELIKNFFKKKRDTQVKQIEENSKLIFANSFNVEIKNIIELNDKTAFLTHPLNKKFSYEDLTIFTQNGNKIRNLKSQKLNLPSNFTLQRNGGVKTMIFIDDKSFALISSKDKDCYFASLININNSEQVFRTKCLPEKPKNNDFNGLGSSNIHINDKILLSIGTPEKHASKNSPLAQSDDYKFGKILEIDKNQLLKSNADNEVEIKIYSKGHRVPQGLTKIKDSIFSVEHGPKGGDELNKIIKGNNYGWPNVSYGTNYLKENGGDGSSYNINHESKGYTEPLFAFVPSVGISSLNKCPQKLKNFYKKPCLMALSLYGNNLRKGHSIIIFLLNDKMTKVNSVEKISLDNLILRHFVTNRENEIFEDENGDIYISADKKGIYKINFTDFR